MQHASVRGMWKSVGIRNPGILSLNVNITRNSKFKPTGVYTLCILVYACTFDIGLKNLTGSSAPQRHDGLEG